MDEKEGMKVMNTSIIRLVKRVKPVRYRLSKIATQDSFKYGLIGVVCFFGIYGILSCPLLPIRKWLVLRPEFLPFYTEIIEKFEFLLKVGLIQESIKESLLRIFQGYVIGALIGCSLGFLMGLFRRIDYLLDPPVTIIRYTPALAWVPLFIIWFGIGELTKILLIVLGVMSVTLIGAYHGVRDIPDVYFKAARVLGADTKMLIRKVILPAASPRILAGFRYAVMGAWGTVVAAELIASKSGIGYLILRSSATFDTYAVIAGIIVLTVCAFAFDTIVRFLTSYLTRWMRRRE